VLRMSPKLIKGVPPGVPPPNDGPEPAAGGKSAVNINRRLKSTANGEGGVPSPNDGPEPAVAGAGAVAGKSAVNINRRLKSTANGEGGGPSPNDGPEPAVAVAVAVAVAGKSAVNINRRLKSTANGEGVVVPSRVPSRVPSSGDGPEPAIAIKNNDTCTPDNATTCCSGGNLARSCEASRDEAMEQLSNTYLASLSELERRVCSIAKDHLESSFDLSRSSGYIAWVGKK
jgi:hypothetical protein